MGHALCFFSAKTIAIWKLEMRESKPKPSKLRMFQKGDLLSGPEGSGLSGVELIMYIHCWLAGNLLLLPPDCQTRSRKVMHCLSCENPRQSINAKVGGRRRTRALPPTRVPRPTPCLPAERLLYLPRRRVEAEPRSSAGAASENFKYPVAENQRSRKHLRWNKRLPGPPSLKIANLGK